MLRNPLVVIVIILRLLSSVLIIINPLWGFFIYLLFDYIDAHILINIVKMRWVDYQDLDKKIDLLGYLAMLYQVGKYTSVYSLLFLFTFRFIGQLAFSFARKQWLLVLFPNLVEVYFIWNLFIRQLGFGITFLYLLILVKMFQEYFLHVYWPKYLKENGYPWFVKCFGVNNEIKWG